MKNVLQPWGQIFIRNTPDVRVNLRIDLIIIPTCYDPFMMPGPKIIKLFSCSAQESLKFILLINVKMPTIVGILTFIR